MKRSLFKVEFIALRYYLSRCSQYSSPTIVLIFPLVVLIYLLVLLVCPLVILLCQFVCLLLVPTYPLVVIVWPFICSLIVFIVLPVGLFKTDLSNPTNYWTEKEKKKRRNRGRKRICYKVWIRRNLVNYAKTRSLTVSLGLSNTNMD